MKCTKTLDEEIARPSTSLLSLPYEILLRIVQSCNGATVQSLRASCKAFQQLVEPILFHTAILYPHMKSFSQIAELSSHPNLRHHVKCLVYDTRYCFFSRRLQQQLGSRYNINVTDDQLEAAYCKMIDFDTEIIEPENDRYSELFKLYQILHHLCLEHLIVTEPGFGTLPNPLDIDDLPKLYRNIRRETVGSLQGFDFEPGFYEFEKTFDSAQKALVVAAQQLQPLKRLEMYNFDWEAMLAFTPLGKDVVLTERIFINLEQLIMHGHFGSDYVTGTHVHNLSNLLSRAIRLEHLDLCLGHDIEAKLDGMTELDVHYLNLQHSIWPVVSGLSSICSTRLKSLKLSNSRCRQSELMSVLDGCKSHLEHLLLRNISLLPSQDNSQPSCLVGFISALSSTLELKKVTIDGQWSNTDRQEWNFEDADEHHCPVFGDETKTMVENFIRNGGHNPLEELALCSGTDEEYQAKIDRFKNNMHGDDTTLAVEDIIPEDNYWNESSTEDEGSEHDIDSDDLASHVSDASLSGSG